MMDQVASQEEATEEAPQQHALEEPTEEAPQEMTDPRPRDVYSSPYLTSSVSLYIGPDFARYNVPQGFLSESAQWSRVSFQIELPEVSEEAGHTLVHYLYTGTYQTLQSQDNDDKITELRRKVLLYGIAFKYGLAGLAKLARENIQSDAEGEVAIFGVLGILKEAFQTMLEDDAGLTPYIKREIKTAFEIDSGLFEKDTFIELFGEAKHFDRILMRIVAELFAEKMAAIYGNPQLTTIDGSSSEAIDAPESSSRLSRQETLREELAAMIIEECAVEYAECEVPVAVPVERAMEYAVCEDPPNCEEPVPFDWNTWGQPWKTDAPSKEATSDAYAEEPTSVPPEEAGSVPPEEAAPVPPEEAGSVRPEEATPIAYAEPTVVFDEAPVPRATSESVPPTKASKNEKKSKKGKEIPLSEHEQSQTGNKENKGKKVKKTSSSLSENGAASQEAILTEQTSKPKKAKKVDKGESSKKAEKVDKGESSKKAKKVDKGESSEKAEKVDKGESSKKAKKVDKGESSKKAEKVDKGEASKKAKKEKKNKLGEPDPGPDLVPDLSLLMVTSFGEPWRLVDENGAASQEAILTEQTSNTKKAKKVDKGEESSKKAKEGKEIKLDVTDSGADLVPDHSTPMVTSFGEPWRLVDIREPIEAATQESSVCASQAEHLLNGEIWKNCSKCRALLSTEFAQNMTAAEDGFEVIF